LFAGAGVSCTTGAAEEGTTGAVIFHQTTPHTMPSIENVRTRKDLADLINSSADPLSIKQEYVEQGGVEYMEQGAEDDIQVVEMYGNSYDEHNNSECDEGLLDENEEEENEEEGEVVYYEEEDETGHEVAAGTAGPEHSDEDMEPDPEGTGIAAASGMNPPDNVAAETNTEEIGAAAEADAENAHIGAAGPVPDPDPELGPEDKEEDTNTEEDEIPAILDPLNPNLRPDSRYFTVRTMRKGCTEPKSLNRRLKNGDQDPGFNIPGDERWYRNDNISCMDRKLNISLSFKSTGTCHTCLAGDHDAWVGRNRQPIVIAASDQPFPANLPADGDGDCIRVLRVEDGSIAEITQELINLAPVEGLLPGTVVLLGAPAQLATISTEKYATEWKRCRNWIKNDLGDVVVLPLIPLSCSGIADTRVVRGLIDLSAWMEDLEEYEFKLIRNTRKGFEEVYLGRKERGEGWADYTANLTLPVSMDSTSTGTSSYVTGKWGKRPTALTALTEAGEKHWVDRMIVEMNRELRADLSTTVTVCRTLSAIKRHRDNVGKMNFLSLGASNASRTAKALRKKGATVTEIGKKGWTISESSIDAVLEQLMITADKDDILILHCLDNRCFFELDSTGNCKCPRKDENGQLHVTGRISVAKDIQLEILLDQLDPLLASRSESLVILVCPVSRHLLPCCNDHEKGSEEEKEIEGKRILKELGHLRRELKGRLLKKGYENVRMIDPMEVNYAASSVGAARAIMQDMFHMTRIGYSRLADDIKDLTHSWMLSRKRKESGSDRPDSKRARMDSSGGTADGKRAGGGGGSRGVGSRRGLATPQDGGVKKKSGAGRGVGSRRGDGSPGGNRTVKGGGGGVKGSVGRGVGSRRGGGPPADKRKKDYGEF